MASHARKGTGIRVEVKVRDNMGRALGEGARAGKQLIEELLQCFGGGLQVRYIPVAQYVDFIRMELGAAINAKAFSDMSNFQNLRNRRYYISGISYPLPRSVSKSPPFPRNK